jgi:hypothetical protein
VADFSIDECKSFVPFWIDDRIFRMKIAVDEQGNPILSPVKDWATAVVEQTPVGVLLAIRFEYQTPDKKTHDSAIQLLLTPDQCSRLGEQLTGRWKEFLVANRLN